MKNQIKILLILLLFAYNAALFNLFKKREIPPIDRYKILTDSTNLAIDDFMRPYEIWSKSSARIRIQITLIRENDSFLARAFVDRHNSWLKKDHNIDGSLFKHELYHARLAMAIAKDLNQKIKFYRYDKKTTLPKLELYRKKLNYLQGKYDSESNHGTNKLMQAYWEYKIDSINNLDAQNQIFDKVSAFFPNPTVTHIWEYSDDTIYGKGTFVNKLEFIILRLNPSEMDSAYLERYFANIIFRKNNEYNTLNLEPKTPNSILFGHSKDTVNKTETYDNLIADPENHFYLARYVFPYFEDQDSTLIKVGERFFNSIKFKSDSTPPKTP